MISFVFSAIVLRASMSLLLNAFLYSIFLSRFISLHSASICSCVSLSSLHILHIWLLCDAIILLFAGIILLLIIPPPNEVGGGVYWIHLVRPSVRLSVRPSVRLSVDDMVSGA